MNGRPALGLTATHYVNPNGLHDPDQVTTARDLAMLALNIRVRHPEYAGMFATESVMLGKARLESQNNLLTHFAGTDRHEDRLCLFLRPQHRRHGRARRHAT